MFSGRKILFVISCEHMLQVEIIQLAILGELLKNKDTWKRAIRYSSDREFPSLVLGTFSSSACSSKSYLFNFLPLSSTLSNLIFKSWLIPSSFLVVTYCRTVGRPALGQQQLVVMVHQGLPFGSVSLCWHRQDPTGADLCFALCMNKPKLQRRDGRAS